MAPEVDPITSPLLESEPGHRKTRKVYDVNGDAHFLTFSCFQRLPLLSKDRTCQWMVEAIELSRRKNPFDLWAWVIMPEHVHLVLLPHREVRIAPILTTMKQSVSRRAMIWLKENAPNYMEQLLDVSRTENSRTVSVNEAAGTIATSVRLATFTRRFCTFIRTQSNGDW